MDTTFPGTATAAPAAGIAHKLASATFALRGWIGRAGRWFAARRKAADDALVIGTMSAHELRDIGLERPCVHIAASGVWTDDYAG